jgi:hypothetical protein
MIGAKLNNVSSVKSTSLPKIIEEPYAIRMSARKNTTKSICRIDERRTPCDTVKRKVIC